MSHSRSPSSQASAPLSAPRPPAGRWLLSHEQRKSPPHWYCWRAGLRHSGSGPARVRIAVDSKYWLYVNGQCILREGGLKRGPAPGDTYADVVDLSSWLRDGVNQIAVHHWHFGRDGFSHSDSGEAGFYWEVLDPTIELEDSWKVVPDPAYYDAGLVRPGAGEGYRLPEVSLGYDARLSLGEWTNGDYDDNTWPRAVPSARAGEEPWGKLIDRSIPQFWHAEPLDIDEPEPDRPQPDETGYLTYRVRIGHNAHFTPRLTLTGLDIAVPFPGLKVQIYSDAPEHVLLAEYLTDDRRDQSWESPGWMNGETLIVKVPLWMKVVSLGYRESGYASSFEGGMDCSDPVCNDLWSRSRRTLYVTMRDTFMDCPDRERAQWWGDEVIQLGQVPYCLEASAYALVRKGIYELAGWQRADGTLFSPCPAGNWTAELPLQMLASIGHYGFREYLYHTGDRETIREALPAAQRYLEIWETDSRGLAVLREGDWAWPDWGIEADHELLTSTWLFLALRGVADMLELSGGGAVAAGQLRVKADALGAAVQTHCRTGDGLYAFPGFPHLPDDRANAMVVLCGLHMEEESPALARWLFQRRQASPYMEKYVLEALCVLDRGELAVRRMKERYSSMLATGSSTLWEKFEEEDFPSNTNNHSWSGGPMIVLSRFLGGLSPAKPGWERIRVAPRAGGLERLRVSVQSPQGVCTLRWSGLPETPLIELQSPVGVPVEVDLKGFLDGTVAWTARPGDGGEAHTLADSRATLDGGSWTLEPSG